MALQTSSRGRVHSRQCGLTEGRISAWQPAGQKDETSKKAREQEEMIAKKEEDEDEVKTSTEHGP